MEKKKMGFKLKATVKIQKSTKTPDEKYLTTFGVWKGKEICTYKCPSGTLEDIKGQFKGLEDGKKKKKPLTFSVVLSPEVRTFFDGLKKKELEVRVFIGQDESNAEWTLFFEGVEILTSTPESKTFDGKGQRTDLRIDAIYKKYIPDSDDKK